MSEHSDLAVTLESTSRALSEQQNAITARRLLVEVWQNGNVDFVHDALAPNVVFHLPIGDILGIDGYIAFYEEVTKSFSDIRVAVLRTTAEGDHVNMQWQMHMKHAADFRGIPASDKEITLSGIGVSQFFDAKIIENWQEWDIIGLLQQLGALPDGLKNLVGEKLGGQGSDLQEAPAETEETAAAE